jgi:hypothetical protein
MKPGVAKRPLVILFILLAGLIAAFVLGPRILAQSSGEYDLSWSTIAGGGEAGVAGSNYVLGGAIGQPGAGTVSGGHYELQGGFWHCFPLGSAGCQSFAGKSKVYIPVITNPNQ